MSEKFSSEFNPEGDKEYVKDLPGWKKEGEKLQAVKIMVVHDSDNNEYYPVFIFNEAEESAKKLEYNVPESGQKIEDIVVL